MKDDIFGKNILRDLFRAYYQARKNKRKTISQLRFEIEYEKKLIQLSKEIIDESYVINRSICFISFKPLKREIFAADFQDRIIHHFIFNYINSIFENSFINDSYSCRKGKGTSYGIKRLNHFIRSCSLNYSKNCYILKLDIKGYFMSINKDILYKKIEEKLNITKHPNLKIFNKAWLLRLIHQIIFNDPTKGCVMKGDKKDWSGLPKSKSLFYAKTKTGLPIGNLTSQLFGNIYLDDFDHFVKYKLGCRYYGRYVDDMVIVHEDKEYLKSIIPIIKEYLADNLFLELHPKKIYLQPIQNGVSFLGVFIKPHRNYILNKTKGNFYKKIQEWNALLIKDEANFTDQYKRSFLSSTNSYVGMLKNFNTYRLRERVLTGNMSPNFKNIVKISEGFDKIIQQSEV
jgi:RNA-directed DNA polymerase